MSILTSASVTTIKLGRTFQGSWIKAIVLLSPNISANTCIVDEALGPSAIRVRIRCATKCVYQVCLHCTHPASDWDNHWIKDLQMKVMVNYTSYYTNAMLSPTGFFWYSGRAPLDLSAGSKKEFALFNSKINISLLCYRGIRIYDREGITHRISIISGTATLAMR